MTQKPNIQPANDIRTGGWKKIRSWHIRSEEWRGSMPSKQRDSHQKQAVIKMGFILGWFALQRLQESQLQDPLIFFPSHLIHCSETSCHHGNPWVRLVMILFSNMTKHIPQLMPIIGYLGSRKNNERRCDPWRLILMGMKVRSNFLCWNANLFLE